MTIVTNVTGVTVVTIVAVVAGVAVVAVVVVVAIGAIVAIPIRVIVDILVMFCVSVGIAINGRSVPIVINAIIVT